MRGLLTALIVAAACAAAVVLAGAGGGGGKAREYRIVFDNAFGLTEGGDFRVGGVRAGKTTGFDVTKAKSGAPKAVVVAKVTEPGFGDFRRDARCSIKPQSLIGEYYVDCQPGSSKEKLPNGGTVPVEHTESTIPQDLVQDIMRRPYRERLRLIITELGTGLAGRPRDLAEVLRRAHPGLRETSKVLRILGDQNRTIERFIADSDTIVRELERNKKDVVRFVHEAGDTAEASAGRRRQLAENFRKLPTFLDELRPTMGRLGELTDAQMPLLADLQLAAPDVNTLLARLGPFAKATRPALSSLGQASQSGTRAFRRGSQEVAELKRLAADAPATAKPLRQFLQTIDDRSRAVDPDRRAKASAPPAPDKTATRAERGFTGMEAVWDFAFWQTLSINSFDTISHVLRAGLTVQIPPLGKYPCSQYQNKAPSTAAERETFDQCNQWLGPDQPGITTRDFTLGGSSARARSASTSRVASRDAATPATRVGERRAPGQPDAGPVPGQRDISKPQVVLPPPVQNLLERLRRGQKPPKKLPVPKSLQKTLPKLPGLGGGGGSTPSTEQQLLDFLLGP